MLVLGPRSAANITATPPREGDPGRGPLRVASPASAYRNPTAGRDVALQIPGMHLAKVRRNLVYKPGLHMDVYRPRNATRPLPAVLFVHGSTGAESPKDWGQYVGWGQLAAASGLAGVTFNHLEDLSDVSAAIRFVRKNGARLGIDGTRLCVAGYSSGVHPALLTALNGSVGRLRCAVAYYGFLTAELPQLSPATYLRATSIPVLVARQATTFPASTGRLTRSSPERVGSTRPSSCSFMLRRRTRSTWPGTTSARARS